MLSGGVVASGAVFSLLGFSVGLTNSRWISKGGLYMAMSLEQFDSATALSKETFDENLYEVEGDAVGSHLTFTSYTMPLILAFHRTGLAAT